MIENTKDSGSEGRTESYSEPAVIVQMSMILDRGLTPAEKVKFKRLEYRISTIFSAVGVAIRVCQGKGEGDQRKVGFIPGLIGPPLISLPASQFLAASEDEIIRELQSRLEEMAKEV